MSAAVQFHSQGYITIPALRVKPHKPGLERDSKAVRYNVISIKVSIENLENITD